MEKKKSIIKKIASWALTICIMLSLLPTLALAATPPEFTVDDLPNQDFKGFVMDYKTVTIAGKTAAKVTVSAYNIDYSVMYAFRFKYDTTKVVPANKNNGNKSAIDSVNFAPIRSITQSMLTADTEGELSDGLSLAGVGCFFSSAYKFDDSSISGAGTFKVDLGPLVANSLSYDTNGIGGRLPQNEVIPLFEMYFIGLPTDGTNSTTTSIPENLDKTFLQMYTTDSSYPKGYAAIDTKDVELPLELCWLNFPQPAATTYDVPFTITATADSNTVHLNAPDVTITKQGGGTPQNYKGGESGVLMTTEGVAVTNSTLQLEEGKYDYTVTPTGADVQNYSPFTGTFDVTTGTNAMVYLHAQAKSAGTKETYTFNLMDGESAKDDAPLADAVVTVNGVKATNTNGAISFNVVPNATYTINIEKSGYKTLVGNVTVGAAGTITSMSGITFKDGAVVMDQTRTNVTIEAKDGTTALADAIITVSANPASNKKVTENMAANELPIVKKADTNGKVSFNLPNGDYLYTIRAGGYSDTVKSLAIADKVTVADADGGNAQTPIDKGAASPEGDFTVEIPATAAGTPDAITEPMYYVVGKLDKEENPTKMTVEVFLKNAKATKGTFGLKYDPAMFKLAATDGFVKSANIGTISNYTVDGKGTVSNPVSAGGYHAFQWDASLPPIDATSTAQLIGTYTLELQTGFSKDKLHSKSLCVAPYSKTEAATQILNAYTSTPGSPTAEEIRYTNEFISKYWRPIDAANAGTPTDSHRLSADFATEGGFYQIYKSGEAAPMGSSDARSQFVFDNSGANGVTFSVNETADGTAVGAPIMGATIKIKEGDKVISTLTTDQYGDATVGLPAGGSYTYTVTCLGYQTKTDTAVPANTDPISVLLSADESHKVRVDDTQLDKIDLLGANRAQNLMDYTFNLQPKAGYKWANAGGPTPAQISFKLTDGTNTTAIASSNITWDAVASCYKLKGAVITGDAKQDLVVSVATDAIIETTSADAPTITVKAFGAGGKFDVTPATGGNSTFNPAVTTDMTAVVETLGAGKGTSATYAFKEGGPVTGGQTPAEGTYEAYIIHKLLINGAEVKLTDTQKIHGVSKQLIEVNNNQTITAIYEKATVDLKEPGDDDDVILPQPPIVPTANPLVSIVVGEGGSADVTISDPSVTETITGPGRVEYQVKATTGTLTAVITPNASLPQPGGGTKEYVIDTVTVDGVKVNTASPAATWDEVTKTLTLTNLAAGAAHTVAVTFKPTDAPGSTEAILNTVHVDGNGKITPLGTNIYKVGDCPTVQFVPDTQWVLGKLELTVPSGTGTDVTEKVENNAYKLDALDAGTTVLEYTFKEQSFVVQLGVDYLSGIKPMTGATIIFERSAGGGLPAKKLQYEMAAPTGSQVTGRFEVPEGTWNVTLKKNGFLPYTVTGFTIAADGSSVGTYKDAEGVLHFGMATETSELKRIKPIIGDANRDEALIALDDAAQIIEGMVSGAPQGSKDYADVDESGAVNAADQGYVSGNFGKRAIVRTYTVFMGI